MSFEIIGIFKSHARVGGGGGGENNFVFNGDFICISYKVNQRFPFSPRDPHLSSTAPVMFERTGERARRYFLINDWKQFYYAKVR